MDQDEKEETIRRYNERLQKYGLSNETLGWSKNRANLRFEILTSLWDFNNSSILDFGCGFGDLFGHLKKKLGEKKIEYLGIDINKKLIELAKQKYPEANFSDIDIFKDKEIPKVDFILSSGVFNYKGKDNLKFIEESINKFYELTNKGFAINFLSDKVEYQLDHTFHTNPNNILDILYTLSNNVVLRNDYMPFEFTVFLRKDIAINKEKTVYENFIKYL